MKKCTKCGVEQELTAFPRSGGKGGLSSWCRQCHHARYAQNRAALEAANLSSAPVDAMGDLDAVRIERGLTIRAIAEALGVNEMNVGKWFNRKTAPRQKNLRAMYEFFGLPLPLALEPGDGGRMPLAVGVCDGCGKEFPIYKAGVRFCSRQCSGKGLSDRQLGANNAKWKGGEYVTAHAGGGYVKELCPEHPKADAGGYVLQHRLVMEQVLGRPLLATERVHHKNGQRDDNRPENLELWTGVGSSKKDPHGVRVVDKVLDMIESLTADERARVMHKLKEMEP